MTPSLLFRPVLVCLAAATVSACGMIDADPHRFENFAENVAAIPLADDRTPPSEDAPATQVAEPGARKPLTVEVMDPHALWDARDGLMPAMAPALSDAAAPAIVEAAVQRVAARPAEVAPAAKPAIHVRPAPAVREGGNLVQIGAYSSETAARAAWARLKGGQASWALDGLSPVYEKIDVNGRQLVRLKVRVPGAGAAAVCAAAGIDDPWCHRAA